MVDTTIDDFTQQVAGNREFALLLFRIQRCQKTMCHSVRTHMQPGKRELAYHGSGKSAVGVDAVAAHEKCRGETSLSEYGQRVNVVAFVAVVKRQRHPFGWHLPAAGQEPSELAVKPDHSDNGADIFVNRPARRDASLTGG